MFQESKVSLDLHTHTHTQRVSEFPDTTVISYSLNNFTHQVETGLDFVDEK